MTYWILYCYLQYSIVQHVIVLYNTVWYCVVLKCIVHYYAVKYSSKWFRHINDFLNFQTFQNKIKLGKVLSLTVKYFSYAECLIILNKIKQIFINGKILFYMNKIPFLRVPFLRVPWLLTFFPIFSLPLGMSIYSETRWQL